MLDKKKKTISIVIPIYNEEECLDQLFRELIEFIDKEEKYIYEVILVNNGSSDKSTEKIFNIQKKDNRFKVIQLIRNFQVEGGLLSALSLIKSDAVVLTYADLQEPLYLINEFIKKWEEGYKNVYGVVQERKGVRFIRKINSQIFYFIMNKLTKGMFLKNVSDYRLVDKSLYEVINNMPENNKVLRGLFAWIGGKSIGIEYKRNKRYAGRPKSFTRDVFRLAINSVFSFFEVPAVIIISMGLFLSIISFCVLIILSIKFILFGVPFDGFGSIMGINLLMFGFLFFILGVLMKYILMISDDIKRRPSFIIGEIRGFDEKNCGRQ